MYRTNRYDRNHARQAEAQDLRTLQEVWVQVSLPATAPSHVVTYRLTLRDFLIFSLHASMLNILILILIQLPDSQKERAGRHWGLWRCKPSPAPSQSNALSRSHSNFFNDDIYNGVLIFKFLQGLRGQERGSPRGSTSLCTSGSILFRARKRGGRGGGVGGGGWAESCQKIQLFFAQNQAAVHQVPSHALSCALNTWCLYFTCSIVMFIQYSS